MEDKTYQYPVLLQWDQGPEKLKELKNKLQLYFGSKKKSDGGECEIRDTDCTRGQVLIYFKEKEAPQRVVQKNPHELVLDKSTPLSLCVFLLDAEISQSMGNLLSSLATSSDTGGASGSPSDKDHQQEDNQSPEIPKRGNSSMTGSTFRNGDTKKLHLKGREDSTGHRVSQKDSRGAGAPEGEEQDHISSTRRSSENDDNRPEESAKSRNESGRIGRQLSKEGRSHPAAPPEGDGASGPPSDKDYQQGNYQSSDFQKGENSLLTRSDSMDGDPKRSEDGSTRQRERKEYRSADGIDRNEHNTESSAPRSWQGNGEKSSGDSFPYGTELRRNSLRHHGSTEEPGWNRPSYPEEPGRNRPSSAPEIFKNVTARIDKARFTDALLKEIKTEYRSLLIEDKSDVVEVTGMYGEIDSLYRHLGGRQEQERGAEKTPDTSSDWSSPDNQADQVCVPSALYERAEKSPDTSSDWRSTDSQADQVCFPSALYEYIMEIYRTEIDNLQRTYGVKIAHRSTPEASTYVRFIPQGSGSSPEKAKEGFTDKVQKVMGDWSQVTVDPSVVPLTFSDIKERVKPKWRNTQVIQGEKEIILRGPRDELSLVKTFLETTDYKPSGHKPADYKPARPPRAVTISTSNMKSEIEVDARHMDILRKLKHRQISDIEKKYNVKMEEKNKKVSSLVTFRSLNAPPDLSPHASHSFITLLQKTFFNIERKEIIMKPEFTEERVSLVQEQLMMAGIDIVMEYSKGTLLLIGHPVHVVLAEERLNERHNSGGDQAAAASVEKMDTDSPSAATQKVEEPDKCPICLCEMEDKVILEKCKHAYCRDCLQRAKAHKPVCAICGDAYGTVIGDQPDGTMNVHTTYSSLPGYAGCGTIEITYDIPPGIQKENHPRPGKHFSGARRVAYLPDNKEGKEILSLLRKAFDQKLIFTVGDSRTSGATDTVTWNDVHHKTSTYGGPQSFGYPDPDYLSRVRDELKAKGVE